MRLAVITKDRLTVLDGRRGVAEFMVEGALTVGDVEQARTADYNRPPAVTYPRHGTAAQPYSYGA